MPYCTACGTAVGETDAYCTNCGEHVGRGRGADGADSRADAGQDDETSTNAGPDDETSTNAGSIGDSPTDAGPDAETSSNRVDDARAEPGADEANGPGVERRTSRPDDAEAEGEAPPVDRPVPASDTRGRIVSGAGVAATIVGAVIPWGYVEGTMLTESRTVNGLDGDGQVTIVLGALAGLVLLVGIRGPWTRRSRAAIALLGLPIAAVGLYYLLDPTAGTDLSRDVARELLHNREGVYLTAFAGALVTLGPLWATVGRYR